MSDTEWRNFEKVVAELEIAMSRQGISVQSPGRLPDKDTGSQREVDVLITVPYSPKPIIIIIECRRRESVQDVTWIEQLAAKRASLNVDRVIAVSSSGFGEPAKMKAQMLGIETRTLKELSAESVQEVVYISSFTFGMITFENVAIEDVECGPLLANRSVPIPEPPVLLNEIMETKDIEAKILIDTTNQERLSLGDMFRRNSDNIMNSAAPEVHPGQPPVRRSVSFDLPGFPPSIQVCDSDPPCYLWKVTITADFWLKEIKTLKPINFHEYTDSDGLLMRRLEYDLHQVGIDCTMILDLYPPNADRSIPVRPRISYEGTEPPPIISLRNYWTPRTNDNS